VNGSFPDPQARLRGGTRGLTPVAVKIEALNLNGALSLPASPSIEDLAKKVAALADAEVVARADCEAAHKALSAAYSAKADAEATLNLALHGVVCGFRTLSDEPVTFRFGEFKP
jgi:hypothetical protein